MGFIQLKSDYSLFTNYSSDSFTIILVYVDDLIVAGNDIDKITCIKTTLDNQFSIKYMGILRYFLGFEIAHSSIGIALC